MEKEESLQKIVVGCWTGTIQLWEFGREKLKKEPVSKIIKIKKGEKEQPRVFVSHLISKISAHTAPVTYLQLCDTEIVSCGKDGSIVIWDFAHNIHTWASSTFNTWLNSQKIPPWVSPSGNHYD